MDMNWLKYIYSGEVTYLSQNYKVPPVYLKLTFFFFFNWISENDIVLMNVLH